ncbi:MAG: aspartate aminotransferase family protein [Thermoplasmata archaeon]
MSQTHDWFSFPDAPRIRHPPPGPKSRELLALQAELETEAVVYPKHFPIAVSEGRGATLEDVDGNRYIDWVAGISVLNLGHRHPRLEKALTEQAQRIWHALELPSAARLDFLKEFRASLPGGLRNHAKVLFTVTGGDAVETAVSIAEFMQGRKGVITFSGAYHGVHGGAVNLTSGRRYRQTSAFRGGPIVRVPFPDPYHPVFDRDGGCQDLMRYLEHVVSDPHSGVDEVGSVLLEPILGEGGYVVPPADFLPSVREFCDRHHLLLIVDEVQTGLGRTGKMWACEHGGVTPDLLCTAKTIGGGLPLSAVAYRDDLGKSLPVGFHLGTFRANPLALAVGAETLRVLRDDDWPARTLRRGEKLIDRFRAIASRHPTIGDVRGKGFMIGLELVRDPRQRTPGTEEARSLRHELLSRGVLMHTCGAYDQVMRFMSPLIIEEELLDRGLAQFDEALEYLESPGFTPLGRGGIAAVPAPRVPEGLAPPVHAPPIPEPPGRRLP